MSFKKPPRTLLVLIRKDQSISHEPVPDFTRSRCFSGEDTAKRPSARSDLVCAKAASSSHSRRYWNCSMGMTTKRFWPRTEISASVPLAKAASIADTPRVLSSLALIEDIASLHVWHSAIKRTNNRTITFYHIPFMASIHRKISILNILPDVTSKKDAVISEAGTRKGCPYEDVTRMSVGIILAVTIGRAPPPKTRIKISSIA
jgi:hypothetical protein